MNDTTPRGWTNEDARRDTSWIQRLSADEVAGFDAALAHAKAAGKPWLAMTADDFPLDARRPRRAAARLRHHAGPLGHVPAEGLPGRPLERRRCQAGVLGHGPACRRGAHPEPGQPGHERRARRRRGLQGGQRPQPRLQHQGRPGLPHGLVATWWRCCAGAPRRPAARAWWRARSPRPRSWGAAAPTCWRCSSSPSTTTTRARRTRCSRRTTPARSSAATPSTSRCGSTARTSSPPSATSPKLPRVTPEQWEALDLLEEIMADPRWCFRMQLEQGDMQLVNNYAIVHSRTPFEDFDEPDRKRHLLRLWLAVPDSQPLPADWAEYFIDTRPGSVRGGLRGSQLDRGVRGVRAAAGGGAGHGVPALGTGEAQAGCAGRSARLNHKTRDVRPATLAVRGPSAWYGVSRRRPPRHAHRRCAGRASARRTARGRACGCRPRAA